MLQGSRYCGELNKMTNLQKKLYLVLFKSMIKNKINYPAIGNFIKYQYSSIMKRATLNYSLISVQLYINKICNLNCEFCYYADALNRKDAKEYNLTVERITADSNDKKLFKNWAYRR